MTSTTTKPTYGELRGNAERILDERVKERVLAGMALLQEKWGPDWADHIDPRSLDLADASNCVLGQLYADAPVSDAQWTAYLDSPEGRIWRHQLAPPPEASGYVRGLAIIDGDLISVEDGPARYGFLESDDDDVEYEELTEAWQIALGCDPD